MGNYDAISSYCSEKFRSQTNEALYAAYNFFPDWLSTGHQRLDDIIAARLPGLVIAELSRRGQPPPPKEEPASPPPPPSSPPPARPPVVYSSGPVDTMRQYFQAINAWDVDTVCRLRLRCSQSVKNAVYSTRYIVLSEVRLLSSSGSRAQVFTVSHGRTTDGINTYYRQIWTLTLTRQGWKISDMKVTH